MKKSVITLLALFLIICPFCKGQDFSINIPYELKNGKMIIKAVVDDVEGNYIFDTGAPTMFTHSRFIQVPEKDVQTKEIKDVNGQTSSLQEVKLNSVLLGETQHIQIKEAKALVLDKGHLIECFDVDGIIGSDLFANLVIRIDSKQKTITVTNTVEPYSFTPHYQTKMTPNAQNLPVISISLGDKGKSDQVLFDTGAESFYAINAPVYESMKDCDCIKTLYTGSSATSVGISGMEKASEKYRVNIPLLKIGRGKFQNVTTETMTGPISLIGTKFLEYGIVTIDYPRKSFYFEPYDEKTVADLSKKRWNIDITMADNHLVIGGAWGKMQGKVKGGEKVISINGKKIDKIEPCDLATNSVIKLEGEKIELVIQDEQGKTKKITMFKE